jgi:hypothetical protein
MIQPVRLALAQAAYAAYGDHTGGLNYQGRTMPAWDNLGPTIQGAWVAAAGEASAIPATQTRYPWRATIRTLLAALPLVPVIVAMLGVGSVPWVASGLVVVAAVTRVLAIPAVDRWLTDHLGGVLAAEPRDL